MERSSSAEPDSGSPPRTCVSPPEVEVSPLSVSRRKMNPGKSRAGGRPYPLARQIPRPGLNGDSPPSPLCLKVSPASVTETDPDHKRDREEECFQRLQEGSGDESGSDPVDENRNLPDRSKDLGSSPGSPQHSGIPDRPPGVGGSNPYPFHVPGRPLPVMLPLRPHPCHQSPPRLLSLMPPHRLHPQAPTQQPSPPEAANPASSQRFTRFFVSDILDPGKFSKPQPQGSSPPGIPPCPLPHPGGLESVRALSQLRHPAFNPEQELRNALRAQQAANRRERGSDLGKRLGYRT